MATTIDKAQWKKEELQEFVGKCVSFTEVFCGVAFYPYQKEFATAIIIDIVDGRSNTLTGLFARQSGKSETAANTAASMMVLLPKLANLKDSKHYAFPQLHKFRKGLWVGIFTPSDNQSETTFRRAKGKLDSPHAKDFFRDPDFAPDGFDELDFRNKNIRYVELNNGSSMLMMSANKQANIESKTYHMILLDESQDLDEFVVNKSIIPMGSATNCSLIATGTPSTTKGFFYKQIQFNKQEQLRPGMQQLHFQYDYKTCQRYNPDYKKFVEKTKRKVGEDSDEFRMAYRLEWLLERGMAVSQEQFDVLTIKSLNIITSNKTHEAIAGLDFGKGSDSTVLTVGRPLYNERDESGRCPVEVMYWWEKLGDDYETIFAELKDEVGKFNIKTMSCDATGVGEPLVDRLVWELPSVMVIPVKFSAQSKDHLYKNFLLMIQEKKVWWPGHPMVRKRKYWKMFEMQMLNLQKEYKNQYLSCHAPEDQKAAHDDFPDSFALMLWCIQEDAMPFVETAPENKLYTGRDWNRFKNAPAYSQFSLR